MVDDPTVDELAERRQVDIASRRAQLRERFAYLTAEIELAEKHGAEWRLVKDLKVLLAFVVRDADSLDLVELKPLAAKGARFTRAGRGEGSVKVLIRAVLPVIEKRLGRKATTLELWQACASKPHKKVKFYGSGTRPAAGWHIKTKGEPDTSYSRFGKSISEVRKVPATLPAGG